MNWYNQNPFPSRRSIDFYLEKEVKRKRVTKLIRVDEYAAGVEVEFLYTDDVWSPNLSVEDAAKLDDVRIALQEKDIRRVARLAIVYRILPVAA